MRGRGKGYTARADVCEAEDLSGGLWAVLRSHETGGGGFSLWAGGTS